MRATSAAEMRPDSTALRISFSNGLPSGLVPDSSAGRLRSESLMPVLTNAGHSTDTPTLALPSLPENNCRSKCRHSDSVTTLCLVTQYTLDPGTEIRPATEAVFTMWHSSCCSSMRGTKLCTPCTTPIRFTPIVHCQSASVALQAGPTGDTPALLNSRCAAPNFA